MIGKVMRFIPLMFHVVVSMLKIAWALMLAYIAWWIVSAAWPLDSSFVSLLILVVAGYVAFYAAKHFCEALPAITPARRVSMPRGSGTSRFASKNHTRGLK